MPKIVDHDQRRLELVSATWRIIARLGMDAATMREIAAEAGFANGALKPYFPTKDDLLAFAFEHVFNQTNRRMAAATTGKTGLAALRAYCKEILPLDEDRLNEARIVIPFWQKALTDQSKAKLHDSSMEQWRTSLVEQLQQARSDGEVSTAVSDEAIAGHVMNMVLGAQITAVLDPDHYSPAQLAAQLDGYLELLRTRS